MGSAELTLDVGDPKQRIVVRLRTGTSVLRWLPLELNGIPLVNIHINQRAASVKGPEEPLRIRVAPPGLVRNFVPFVVDNPGDGDVFILLNLVTKLIVNASMEENLRELRCVTLWVALNAELCAGRVEYLFNSLPLLIKRLAIMISRPQARTVFIFALENL